MVEAGVNNILNDMAEGSPWEYEYDPSKSDEETQRDVQKWLKSKDPVLARAAAKRMRQDWASPTFPPPVDPLGATVAATAEGLTMLTRGPSAIQETVNAVIAGLELM